MWSYLLELIRRMTMASRTVVPTWEEWVWPMPVLVSGGGEAESELRPVVSSGFGRGTRGGGTRDHLGVDIVYRRGVRGAERLPELSKMYQCPSGVPIVSPGPGVVWYARWQSTGWTVLVYHDISPIGPMQTYHTHLSAIDVQAKQRVVAGSQLGTVGYSPSSPPSNINHDHCEVRVISRGGNRDERVIDPEPLMTAQWGYVRWHRTRGYVGRVAGSGKPWNLEQKANAGAAFFGAGSDLML